MKQIACLALHCAVACSSVAVAVSLSCAPTPRTDLAPRRDRAILDCLRYEAPQGFQSSRKGGPIKYDLADLPEGHFYRVYVDGAIEAGYPLREFYVDACKDFAGLHIEGGGVPHPTISQSSKGHRMAYAEYEGMNKARTEYQYSALAVVECDGFRQIAGVLTNDPDLWKSRRPWMKRFFESLEFDRDCVARKPRMFTTHRASE